MIRYLSLALSAVQAISSMSQGQDEKKEYEYNADLLGRKAEAIELKKQIDFAQYERLKAKTYSTSMAYTAAMGIRPTGSALAVVLNAENQISIDQTISMFNIEQEKQYTIGEAAAQERAGGYAVKKGNARAFSSILGGVSKFAQQYK